MKNLKQLILALLLCCTSGMAWAYDFEKDGIYYNITSNSTPYTVEVTYKDTNYNSYSGDVVIPESVTYNSKTYLVKSIGQRAFKGCTGLTSVTIPNSVTNIGENAFNGCTGLTSVTIPNSVTTIGNNVFFGCSGLTSITIPNSVTTIGVWAFYGCSGLTSVTIPNSVTSIGAGTFIGCTNLTAINVESGNASFMSTGGVLFNYLADTLIAYPSGKQGSYQIPNSVTTIGDCAFYDCYGLTSVTIPNSVTTIGNYAFRACSGLTFVTIPNSVTMIGSAAFDGCTGLTFVTIPNSVTTIGVRAFRGCTGLTSVSIPNSVTTIGGWAFSGCTGLTTVYFNATNCTDMGSSGAPIFEDCIALATLNIGNNVQNIPDYSFCYCTGLTSVTIPNSARTIGYAAFWGCTNLTSVTIPNSVTTIKADAFGETGLISVTIPSSVTVLGNNVFGSCTGLTSIGVDSGNTHYKSIDGVVFSYSEDTLVAYPAGRQGGFVIPNTVMVVGADAFAGCNGLDNVVIGNSVNSIRNYAFYQCTGLNTMIALGNTPPSLGEISVFEGCSNIESLVVCCGNKEAYEASAWSQYFSTIEEDCNLYEITTGETVEGGSIEISENEASLGETVLVYVTAEDGYEIENIVACNANDTTQLVPISLMEDKGLQLTYSFTMMPFPVKVEATFRNTEGVSEGNNIATSLYPNPTSGKITIEAEDLQRVQVFNTLGQKVYETTASDNSFECNMSRYGAGVYIMQIETEKGVATKRVVVE